MKEVVNALVPSASARSLDLLATGRRSTPGPGAVASRPTGHCAPRVFCGSTRSALDDDGEPPSIRPNSGHAGNRRARATSGAYTGHRLLVTSWTSGQAMDSAADGRQLAYTPSPVRQHLPRPVCGAGAPSRHFGVAMWPGCGTHHGRPFAAPARTQLVTPSPGGDEFRRRTSSISPNHRRRRIR